MVAQRTNQDNTQPTAECVPIAESQPLPTSMQNLRENKKTKEAERNTKTVHET